MMKHLSSRFTGFTVTLDKKLFLQLLNWQAQGRQLENTQNLNMEKGTTTENQKGSSNLELIGIT